MRAIVVGDLVRRARLERVWARLALWLLLPALVCGWWALARGLAYARLGLAYAAPLDGQEGMALWEASLLRSGAPLYQPPHPDRFVSAPYPPLHPLLLAVLGEHGSHVFFMGRLLSLVAVLLIALLGGLLTQQVTRSRWAGATSAVVLLSFVPLQLWALRIKPDPLGLAFTVLGLWLVARWEAQHGLNHTLILAALAFTLAHFTKQTLVAGPLAAATYLWLHERRLALRWAALTLGLVGASWLTLDLVTHGQYTYHIWILHKLPWYAHRFWKLAAQLRDAWPLLLLGLIGLGVSWQRPTVINAYLLWAPASLIGAGVTGAHHNHLLETGIALALAGGQAVGLGLTRGGVLRLVAPVLIAAQLLVWRAPLPWFAGEFSPDPHYTRYIEFIRATPGEVLADDVGLLYAAGRALRYDDPAAQGPAAVLGLWDQQRLVAEIRAGHFSAIILPIDVFADGIDDPADRWTPEMLAALREAYAIKFRDSLIIYAPRGSF